MRGLLSPPNPTPIKPVGGEVAYVSAPKNQVNSDPLLRILKRIAHASLDSGGADYPRTGKETLLALFFYAFFPSTVSRVFPNTRVAAVDENSLNYKIARPIV